MTQLQLCYVSPATTRCRVQTEGGLCAGSADVINSTEEVTGIDAHEVNSDFDYKISGESSWEKQ